MVNVYFFISEFGRAGRAYFIEHFEMGTLLQLMKRVIGLLHLLKTRQVKGVIIFSTRGFSFYERSLMACICRLYSVKSVFLMRTDLFIRDTEKGWFNWFFAKMLLKFPNKVGIQGDICRPSYQKLGVPLNKMVTVRN